MNNMIEDPAVGMARRTLFKNNPAYRQPHIASAEQHIPTATCEFCKKTIRTKGSRVKFINGKRRHMCVDCFELHFSLQEVEE